VCFFVVLRAADCFRGVSAWTTKALRHKDDKNALCLDVFVVEVQPLAHNLIEILLIQGGTKMESRDKSSSTAAV
jgi:hypothetical protein